MLNAVLGEENVLPTNGMRACTATTTEVSFAETSGCVSGLFILGLIPDLVHDFSSWILDPHAYQTRMRPATHQYIWPMYLSLVPLVPVISSASAACSSAVTCKACRASCSRLADMWHSCRYEAEVELMTKEEWQEMLPNLFQDLMGEEGTA